MRTLKLFRKLPVWLLGALLCMGGAATSYAVDDLGLFELDGNAVDFGGAGDDWETLCDPDQAGPPYPSNVSCQNEGGGPAGNADVFTGIIADPAPNGIYTGGSKDILPFSQLGHTDGSVPDKNEITNAYAAAYLYEDSLADPADQIFGGEDQLIVYFGADRIANTGDAFLGFWFFKDDVALNEDTGEFIGERSPGDTLVLVNFPQANNALPLVQVVVWDPTCSKAANNNPQPGQCAAKNLKLLFGASGAGAVCSSLGGLGDPGAQPACAISNDEGGANDPTPAPWPYTSKDGFVQQFPFETFFSGGINLTELVGSDTCFSSFMAETRSSSSFTAQLKDLVVGDFPLCNTNSVTKIWKDVGEDGVRTNDVEIPHEPDEDPINVNDVIVGDLIYDEVIVTGSALGGDLNQDPTGDVLFTLYATADCSGDGINGTTMIPDGEGGMETVFGELVALIDDADEDGTAHAYSTREEISAPGDYSWRATYLGDNAFPPSVSACESFNVIQPKLEITKDVSTCLDPDTLDSGSFTLQYSLQGGVLGTAPNGTNKKDGGTTGFFGVSPGTYVVNEIGGAKDGGGTTDLNEYVKLFEPAGQDCAGGTVTLGGTDMKTCTIVNVRKPHLIVKKMILGTAPDSGLFNLQVNGTTVDSGSAPAGTSYVSGDGSNIGNNGMVRVRANIIADDQVDPADFGNFDVGEAAGSGTDILNYQTSITCDDDLATEAAFSATTPAADRKVTVNMDAGQVVTCTITNIPVATAAACPTQ